MRNPGAPTTNLADRVDAGELDHIREELHKGVKKAACGELWRDGMQRWYFIEDRRYGWPGPRPGEVQPPPLPCKAPPPVRPPPRPPTAGLGELIDV